MVQPNQYAILRGINFALSSLVDKTDWPGFCYLGIVGRSHYNSKLIIKLI
jgi:hypothetical protein